MIERTALVTGSNRGIGRAIVEELAANKCHIVAHARKDTSEFNEFIKWLQKEYGIQVYKVIFDVTDSNTMKSEVLRLRKEKIEVDILVNCAGIAGGNLLAITPLSEIRHVFDVNLFSYMELSQLLINSMIKRKSGNIINVASFEGINLYPGNSAYGVSKAAVIAWTKVLAKELGNFGIRVNAVAPGYVDTEMVKNTNSDEIDRIMQDSAIKRVAVPKEIAYAVNFLASEKASFITGEIMRVDGGMI